MCGVRSHLYSAMKRGGLAARLGEGEIFLEQPVRQTSTLLAIRHAYTLIPDPCPGCPREGGAFGDGDLYYEI
jgi:hypothetical protein